MNRLNKSAIIVVCVAFILSVSGCAIPLSKKLIGRWQQYKQDNQRIESFGWLDLSSDNLVTLNFSGSQDPQDIIAGTYYLSGENQLVMDMDVSRDGRNIKNFSIIGKVSFTDNGDLILEIEDAPPTYWKRVQ